jgi:hypothetical protein
MLYSPRKVTFWICWQLIVVCNWGHITSAGELACLSSEFIPSPAQATDPAMLAAVQSGASLPLSPLALVVSPEGKVIYVACAKAYATARGRTVIRKTKTRHPPFVAASRQSAAI